MTCLNANRNTNAQSTSSTMAFLSVSSLQKAADESRKRERFESTFSNLLLSESQAESLTTSSSPSASAQLLQIKLSESQQRQQNAEEEAKLQRIVLAQHEKNKSRVVNSQASERSEDSAVVNALVGMHQSDLARFDEGGASRRAMKSGASSRRRTNKQQRNAPNASSGQRRTEGKSAGKLAAKAASGRRSKF
jgi:hypothetical protein